MTTSPPFDDLAFLTKEPITFLPRSPGSSALSLRVTRLDIGPNYTHWLVGNAVGAMTAAGVPAFEPEHTAQVLRLKLFPGGEDERARWLEHHLVLQEATLLLNSLVHVPNSVLPGAVTATMPDGQQVTLCAALMQLICNKCVGQLDDNRNYVIARSLLLFGMLMREDGVTFGDLRTEHFSLSMDPVSRRGAQYSTFRRCVTLTEWSGMSLRRRGEPRDEVGHRKDAAVLEEVAMIILRYA
ncbi:hypothetical protein FA95DRAFT_1566157 [Auriscalpium vulgare]|uniref:Uncharacterized protein n=1 Tax=Auriscalpium vulgare TaxID=40419 RepID=A0ACB8RA15_9AGAM|nr:hypothetical protein FA95DRAFT_1566157 [Auriscalpium vulgare]